MLKLFYLLNILLVSGTLSTFVAAQSNNPWTILCTDQKNRETCFQMSQSHNATQLINGKKANSGRILRVALSYVSDKKTKKRNLFLSIQLPLGVDIRPGVAIQVDKKKEINLKYLRCTTYGCDVSILADKKILKLLKAGKELKIGFRAWGNNETDLLIASLRGVTNNLQYIK